MKYQVILHGLLLVLLLAACGDETAPDPAAERLGEVSPNRANFVLHAANMSAAIPEIDLRVWIDDKLAVDARLPVGEDESFQHGWRTYHFRLEPGTHRIWVESADGGARLVQTIEIKAKHWGTLMYWYYPEGSPRVVKPCPRHFYFDLAETAPSFA